MNVQEKLEKFVEAYEEFADKLEEAFGKQIDNEIDDEIMRGKECPVCDAYQECRVDALCERHKILKEDK